MQHDLFPTPHQSPSLPRAKPASARLARARAIRTTTASPQSGWDLAQTGMNRAADHADSLFADWSEAAGGYLRWFVLDLRDKGGAQFTTEDVRAYAEKAGLPKPPDNRAWGSVMVRAKHAGVMRKVGFVSAKNPKVHCTTVALWEIA